MLQLGARCHRGEVAGSDARTIFKPQTAKTAVVRHENQIHTAKIKEFQTFQMRDRSNASESSQVKAIETSRSQEQEYADGEVPFEEDEILR